MYKNGGSFLWDEFQVTKMWLSKGILAKFQVQYWRFLFEMCNKVTAEGGGVANVCTTS